MDITAWFMLYFFSFEMRHVADLVKSDSEQEYARSRLLTNRLKYSLLSLTTVTSLAFHASATVRLLIHTDLNLLNIISRALYLCGFLFIAYQWLSLARLFAILKRSKLASRHETLSRFNWFVIVWAVSLSTLMVCQHLSSVICGAIEPIIDSEAFKVYFMIDLYPVDTLLTFLTASSLLFLFSFQARKQGVQSRADSHVKEVRQILSEENPIMPN